MLSWSIAAPVMGLVCRPDLKGKPPTNKIERAFHLTRLYPGVCSPNSLERCRDSVDMIYRNGRNMEQCGTGAVGFTGPLD